MSEGALLIIDLLEDFIAPDGALTLGPDGERACAQAGLALASWRRRGGLVVHVTDAHQPNDPEFSVWPVHCVVGTLGARERPEVAAQSGELVLPKQHFSAFYKTELEDVLRQHRVRSVTLCGVCTNICVLYTAADAQMRGLGIEVLADACAGTSQAAHRFALGELAATLGARIV
jgi:nicotinamidase-related amidase